MMVRCIVVGNTKHSTLRHIQIITVNWNKRMIMIKRIHGTFYQADCKVLSLMNSFSNKTCKISCTMTKLYNMEDKILYMIIGKIWYLRGNKMAMTWWKESWITRYSKVKRQAPSFDNVIELYPCLMWVCRVLRIWVWEWAVV